MGVPKLSSKLSTFTFQKTNIYMLTLKYDNDWLVQITAALKPTKEKFRFLQLISWKDPHEPQKE